MEKQKIILYLKELENCPCYDKVLRIYYDTYVVFTEEKFFRAVNEILADAAIICFRSAYEKDIESVQFLDSLYTSIPVLVFSKTLSPEFIRTGTLKGISRFLVCDMEIQGIKNTIDQAIRDNGLRKYIESFLPKTSHFSTYIPKLINEIVHIFPCRCNVKDYAEKLGITRCWLNKLCKEAFDTSLTILLRRIWVYQALCLMQHTNMDNKDISRELNYCEESSMARDFHKEIGINPSKAREELIKHNPEELFI